MSSTETAETRFPGVIRTAGVLGVALLALTACGDTGEGDDAPQDEGQEGVDPDGAEDQGDEPDEIAEDEDEDEAAGEAPEIEEISEEIWSNMESAESVVLDASRPLDPEELEGLVPPEELSDDATIQERYSGQLDGSALTVVRETQGAEAEYITFDGETYLRGEHELEAFLEQFPGELEEEELREELEGKWVEYTEFFPEGFSISQELADFRESFEEAGGFGELESSTEERDGEEVWVYTDDDREFVVRAGDEPVFLSLFADNEGEVFEAEFTDWDSAEEPEEPDEEDILTMEDLEGLLH